MDEFYGILTAYELRLGIDNLPKGEENFKVIKKKKFKRKNLRLTIMKNLMKKKPILLNNFRKDQGSTKESCPSNVLIVAKFDTFKPSVIIPRKTLRMKMTKINNTRKRENSNIRKSTKEKIISTQKKKKRTSVHLRLVTVMMKSFF